MKTVRQFGDLPARENLYVIVIFKTRVVYFPGDERSRTNPGHGCAEHYETMEGTDFLVTTNRREWLDKIGELLKEKPDRNDIIYFEVKTLPKIKVETVVKEE